MGRGNRQARQHTPASRTPADSQPSSPRAFLRSLLQSVTLIALGAVVTFAIMTSLDDSARRIVPANANGGALPFDSPVQPAVNSVSQSGPRTVWQLLALPDEELEKVDIVELNLAVAREIPGLEDLDIAKYQRIVDGWANDIRPRLPAAEQAFARTPGKWQNDVRFFRLGVVASYLNEHVGIAYIDDQKQAQIEERRTGKPAEIYYTNPGDLFLFGLIDTNRGTCGNMPTLHVAMGRRLGWPVSLAVVKSHTVCRFDDGQVIYNIETTHTEQGGMFSSATDDEYIEDFGLPELAVTSGSDLSSMTARQMLGLFISLRARHFADTGRMDLADRDYGLARALLPNSRITWKHAMGVAVARGTHLFEPGEADGPSGLLDWMNTAFAGARTAGNPGGAGLDASLAEVERLNVINRMRIQQRHTPGMPGQPVPGMPVNPYAPTVSNHNGQYQPPNPYGPNHPGAGSP